VRISTGIGLFATSAGHEGKEIAMHFPKRIYIVLIVFASMLGWTFPVLAAAPSNDDFANATVIGALPFTDSIDTQEATAAEGDPAHCPNSRSVWYRFTPTRDMWIDANTFGSNYDTTLGVYIDSPIGLIFFDCNDDADDEGSLVESQVVFAASAGTTYYFLVGAYGGDDGSDLVFSVGETAPPVPLDISLTLSNVGSFNSRTGEATVSGTVSCNVDSYIIVYGDLRQSVGRVSTIIGDVFELVNCIPEEPIPWRVTVVPDSGKFAGGSAKLNVYASGSTHTFPARRDLDSASMSIMLKK
jgi:hypothetical protein